MDRYKVISTSIIFLWGSGMSYIFYDAYHKNKIKKIYNQMTHDNITPKSPDINYNQFDDP